MNAPRAIHRVVAGRAERVERRVRQLERDALLGQARRHAAQPEAHDLADLGLGQRLEDDELVDAVQELGLEVLADLRAPVTD